MNPSIGAERERCRKRERGVSVCFFGVFACLFISSPTEKKSFDGPFSQKLEATGSSCTHLLLNSATPGSKRYKELPF